ncbi:hypothetical protein BLOT_010956 [Blomia tropicalis]|nr:hypothetical protein BLOT_010956 [Blomia tropicalis]
MGMGEIYQCEMNGIREEKGTKIKNATKQYNNIICYQSHFNWAASAEHRNLKTVWVIINSKTINRSKRRRLNLSTMRMGSSRTLLLFLFHRLFTILLSLNPSSGIRPPTSEVNNNINNNK